jgi:hypothetical protein
MIAGWWRTQLERYREAQRLYRSLTPEDIDRIGSAPLPPLPPPLHLRRAGAKPHWTRHTADGLTTA